MKIEQIKKLANDACARLEEEAVKNDELNAFRCGKIIALTYVIEAINGVPWALENVAITTTAQPQEPPRELTQETIFEPPKMEGNWFETNFKKMVWLIKNDREEEAARIMYKVYKSGAKDACASIVPNFGAFMADIRKELVCDEFENSFWMFNKDNPNRKS